MPYVYILECSNNTYYTGSTVNLEERLKKHFRLRGSNYTKKTYPVRLVYFEQFSRIYDAFRREKQIQGWSHTKKKALVEGKNEILPALSKNYTQYPRNR